MYKRVIESQIIDSLFTGKAVLVYGPRQVGKTTLVKKIAKQYKNTIYMTCDNPSTRTLLTNPSLQQLQNITKNQKIIIIDEAQRVENIGITIKLIVDNIADIQVIATGSSSFELAQSISEPLTGRKIEFHLYPLSRGELCEQHNIIEQQTLYKQLMITGSYPDIIKNNSRNNLKTLVDSYLYKDILEYQKVKKADTIVKLLQAIALQIGSEVSYQELGRLVGLDLATVERYIDLLEKSFVIFRLPSLSKNVRNELKKSKKIYFWDLGVRNALIDTFNPVDLRNDTGALRENFWIAERLKCLSYIQQHKQTYFWRTSQQQEIDYIEYADLQYDAYEIKRSTTKNPKISSTFADNYQHVYHIINPQNFGEYL